MLPAAALAQGATGTIAGAVRDTSGAVMPGVTVEASSPALIEKVRTVVTDDQGLYKIIDLRPGTYTVTFTLPGFNTVRREGFELSASFTATVDAEMRVGSVEETVTVSGQSPLVDVQNVLQQRAMTRDVMDAVPTNKSFTNLAVLIPGITTRTGTVPQGGTGQQDVGGSAGDGSPTMVIHGSRNTDQQFDFDGMPLHNGQGRGGGLYGIYINNGSVQEVIIEVSGQDAQQEASGVRVNLIPKQGGNTFKGFLFTNYTNNSLQSDNLTADIISSGLKAVNSTNTIWDFNPAGGGPLLRDRLWFYSAFRTWGTYNNVAGMYVNKTPTAFAYTPDLSQQAISFSRHRDQDIRFTWQATPRNKLSAYYNYETTSPPKWGNDLLHPQGGGSPSATTAPEAVAVSEFHPEYAIQGTWTFPVTSRLLLEAGGTMVAIDYSGNPAAPGAAGLSSVTDLGTNLTFQSPVLWGHNRSHQHNYHFSTSYVTGSHAIKAGVFFMNTWVWQTQRSGNDVNLQFSNGAPVSVTLWATPLEWRERMRASLSLFVQEQWTHKRLTLNLGGRFDHLNVDIPAQHLPAGQYVPARDFAPVSDVPNWTDVTPRLGAAYDLFGNSKTAVKASLGKYMAAIGTLFARPVNPVQASVNSASATWTDLNHDLVPQANELGPLSNANFGQLNITQSYDPNLSQGWGKRFYNWETSVGVQHQLTPGVAMNASYFWRWFGNFTEYQNLAVTQADFNPYCITAPADSRLPGGGGYPVCGMSDVTPAKFGQVNNLITLGSNLGGGEYQHWNGADLGVSARLQHGVLISGGLSTGKETRDNCNVVGKTSNPVLGPGFYNSLTTIFLPMAGPNTVDCHYETPYLTQVKLLGVYALPWWGLETSAAFQNAPGPDITADYVATNANIAPSLGRTLAAGASARVLIPLIAPGTLFGDRLNQVDLRLGKVFNVGRARIRGVFDLYNLFNASPVLTVNTRYGPAWQTPTSILVGRLMKFGAQLDF
jgi:hypothetical protein